MKKYYYQTEKIILPVSAGSFSAPTIIRLDDRFQYLTGIMFQGYAWFENKNIEMEIRDEQNLILKSMPAALFVESLNNPNINNRMINVNHTAGGKHLTVTFKGDSSALETLYLVFRLSNEKPETKNFGLEFYRLETSVVPLANTYEQQIVLPLNFKKVRGVCVGPQFEYVAPNWNQILPGVSDYREIKIYDSAGENLNLFPYSALLYSYPYGNFEDKFLKTDFESIGRRVTVQLSDLTGAIAGTKYRAYLFLILEK